MKAWNADRAVLRHVLLRGLEDEVEFGRRFAKYGFLQSEEGVEAFFDDGSSVRGCMIVGADGVRSPVRRQMLDPSEHVLLDTEGRAIFGKTLITDGIWAKPPEDIGSGISLIGDPNDEIQMKLFSDVMSFDRSCSLQVELPEDYVYWVLVFPKARTGMSDEELFSLSRKQSAELSEKLTEDWFDGAKNMLKYQDPEAANVLAFLMAEPNMKEWKPDHRVTLIGDAAHPMPPVGGVGANAAFQDAAALAKVIKQGINDGVIQVFEDEMRERARKALSMSGNGAGNFFGMKPVEQLKPATLWS